MTIAEYNSPLAENISEVIRTKGVRPGFIAEQSGLSNQEISDSLNGRRIIKACDVLRIAAALGVTPNDLYGISESVTP